MFLFYLLSDFRGKVLGPTDPADSPEGALRGTILKVSQCHLPPFLTNGIILLSMSASHTMLLVFA